MRETTPGVQGLQEAGRKQRVEVIQGRRAILAFHPRLVDLAGRSGQNGEADDLPFFITLPGSLRKKPWLIYASGLDGLLQSAVLLYEYRVGPFGLSIFTTSDPTGRRNVLAPPQNREMVAAAAAGRLLQAGAQAVHIAFSPTYEVDARYASAPALPSGDAILRFFGHSWGAQTLDCSGRWTLAQREIRSYLPLASTFDATLAPIGQRTRSNLRYYRRRAESQLGSTFIPAVKMAREEFISFDRRCHYPVGDRNAAWRFDSLSRIQSPYLSGIRGRDGDWLALVGGRRQSSHSEIDWQMNRADLPAYSLGTVLRSCLIEHEISLGSTHLFVEGGTPQAMGLSFAVEQVADMIVRRESLYGELVTRLGPRIAPAPNYLAQMLRRPDLRWHRF